MSQIPKERENITQLMQNKILICDLLPVYQIQINKVRDSVLAGFDWAGSGGQHSMGLPNSVWVNIKSSSYRQPFLEYQPNENAAF